MKCPHCDGTGELDNPSFGTLVMSFRKQRGMTQADLAKAVGKSRAQVANIESGRTDIPISQLSDYAAALSCAPKDLIP